MQQRAAPFGAVQLSGIEPVEPATQSGHSPGSHEIMWLAPESKVRMIAITASNEVENVRS
jgi:hypothetical protein